MDSKAKHNEPDWFFVGIDPGRKTGLVVLHDSPKAIESEVILAAEVQAECESLNQGVVFNHARESLLVAVEAAINKSTWENTSASPELVVVIERPFVALNPASALFLAGLGATYATVFANSNDGIPERFGCNKSEPDGLERTVFFVAPLQVKKFATKTAKSDKSAMRVAIFKQYGFEHESNNVVDAFAMAHFARAIHYSTNFDRWTARHKKKFRPLPEHQAACALRYLHSGKRGL